MMRSNKIITFVIGTVLGFSAGYAVNGLPEMQKPVPKLETTVKQTRTISRVVDGDTVYITEGIEVLLSKIRLLGINTPERGEPLYREAKEKLEELIAGKDVFLERDRENIDRYGRALRYVVVDGRNLNIEMVRLGYTKAFMYEGLKYEKELLDAEKEAREHKKGVWADK